MAFAVPRPMPLCAENPCRSEDDPPTDQNRSRIWRQRKRRLLSVAPRADRPSYLTILRADPISPPSPHLFGKWHAVAQRAERIGEVWFKRR